MVTPPVRTVSDDCPAPFVPVATWVFAGFFGLNTVGNVASRSAVERVVMTPVTALLTSCFIAVAVSPLATLAPH